MRRTITGDHVLFDLRPYWALTPPQIHALDQAADRYGQSCTSTPASPCHPRPTPAAA